MGFEIFDSWIFLSRKKIKPIVHKVSQSVSNKASIHSTDFSSIVFIITGIPFCCSEFLISFACDLWVTGNPCWKFLRLRNSAGDFLGVKFWSRDFFGFAGSPRGFLGFDFCPHSIIISGIVSWPLYRNMYCIVGKCIIAALMEAHISKKIEKGCCCFL